MCVIDWTMARVEAGVAGVTGRNYCNRPQKECNDLKYVLAMGIEKNEPIQELLRDTLEAEL